jgi:hypothetical protein
MPTPESAEAFANLVAARTTLTEFTKRLDEAKEGLPATRALHASLQTDWDETFRAFEAATTAFSETVKHLHEEVESRRRMTVKPT